MKSSIRKASTSMLMAFSGWGLNWGGVINNRQGEWWLIAQIILITAHLSPAWPSIEPYGIEWPKTLSFIGACIFFFGIVLAGKAFINLGPSLSPLPFPKAGASLITFGSYKTCRHPLYKALLISSCGVMIWLGSLLHMILFVFLCKVLISKAKKEEHQLKEVHSKYGQYIANTPAILKGIPFFDWQS